MFNNYRSVDSCLFCMHCCLHVGYVAGAFLCDVGEKFESRESNLSVAPIEKSRSLCRAMPLAWQFCSAKVHVVQEV